MTRLLPSPQIPSRMLRLRGRLWVLGMTLALLLSQSLGQLHAVKHDWSLHGQQAEHNAQKTQHGDRFFELLFSSHNGDSDCRLFSQASDGHAMATVAAVLLPGLMPSLLVAVFAGDALARCAALFDARGPPLTF